VPGVDVPPLWRESRVGLELATLLRDPIWRGEAVADGQGQPVMLVAGFLAGDDSLRLMAGWLKRTGHRPSRGGLSSNVDCSAATVDRLELRLERLAERTGQKVAIIGQSRGGSLAKVVAHRRPELVSGIVTLGSPTRNPLDVHPVVRAQITLVGLFGTLGVPGLFGRTCLDGDCCASFRDDLRGPLPPGVGYVSVYSRSDGIVGWRSCLDEGAEHVEVVASHCGMAVNAQVYRAVADALARFRAGARVPRLARAA
jgi:pimeloyl-ACP methyl ester carboxylesterase